LSGHWRRFKLPPDRGVAAARNDAAIAPTSHAVSRVEESIVNIRVWGFGLAGVAMSVGVSASQYPMLDMVAQKVIQRYQASTCEQLWEARGKPKPQEEQNLLEILRGDPQMRKVFIDEVAGPVANKMFDCGLLP
jgi:hypothetical protein